MKSYYIKVGNMIHPFSLAVCLPIPLRFRKHKGHDPDSDVQNKVVPAKGVKNCVKYFFVGRYLLTLLTRQFLIWSMF